MLVYRCEHCNEISDCSLWAVNRGTEYIYFKCPNCSQLKKVKIKNKVLD